MKFLGQSFGITRLLTDNVVVAALSYCVVLRRKTDLRQIPKVVKKKKPI